MTKSCMDDSIEKNGKESVITEAGSFFYVIGNLYYSIKNAMLRKHTLKKSICHKSDRAWCESFSGETFCCLINFEILEMKNIFL